MLRSIDSRASGTSATRQKRVSRLLHFGRTDLATSEEKPSAPITTEARYSAFPVVTTTPSASTRMPRQASASATLAPASTAFSTRNASNVERETIVATQRSTRTSGEDAVLDAPHAVAAAFDDAIGKGKVQLLEGRRRDPASAALFPGKLLLLEEQRRESCQGRGTGC